jgi:hypothetical protein
MTIYNTAYQTTACANFVVQPIVSAIHEARLRDYLACADGVAYVDMSTGASGQVKAFKHPLLITKHDVASLRHSNELKLEPFLAMDVRAAGRFDAVTNRFKVTNSTLYKNLMYRAGLTSLWLTNGATAFRSITPTALSIFAAWLGEAIGFKYALDPKAKIETMIVAGIFYQSNHVEGIEFDKGNEARYVAGIANALKVSVTDVMRIYNQTQVIGSIEDFCNKLKLVLNNVRLENLNHGVLITLMGGTWAGDNAIELTAVAMEHPPTWISLVHEAATNLALKKVGLSRIVERHQYKDGLERLASLLKSSMPETAEKVAREVPAGL